MKNLKKLKEIEELIKSELGISTREVIIGIYPYIKKGKKYYRILTYDRRLRKNRRYHVPVKKQEFILLLMEEYAKALEEYKSVISDLKALLKEGNAELIQVLFKELEST